MSPPPGATVRVGVAPMPLRYMLIDGTNEHDSAVFGGELEKLGWRNVIGADFQRLPPVESEPPRVVDPAHPFLPIYQASGSPGAKSVAVICPTGLNGEGKDSFWRSYVDQIHDPYGDLLKGRYAAAERASQLTGRLFLRPAVQFSKKLNAWHLADDSIAGSVNEHAATLLYVSSHGWLGGFMRGNGMTGPSGEYFIPSPYFVVGKAAKQGLGFRGPIWLVLAQCSTVNSTTWALWARVLANSNPGVRGILAYEESAPDPIPGAHLGAKFLEKLKAKKSFLMAWKEVNDAEPTKKGGRKWSAIIHEDAIDDTLAGFASFSPLRSVATTASKGPYIGFLSSHPMDRHGRRVQGERVLDVQPPFALTTSIYLPDSARWVPVEPHNLDEVRLIEGYRYRYELKAPAGKKLESATLELIHIRPTYKKQFAWSTIFSQKNRPKSLEVKGFETGIVRLQTPPVPSTLFDVAAHNLSTSGVDMHHSYLWVRCSIVLTGGERLHHDFKTSGLLY